ncbi:hypothetical protein SAMN04515618_10610 [Collimonas sp. OK307]|uniref:hypothetical protein n=1 Tax=Collimonas sp. OK307 TaxID=1801620 RepID=UPI0008E79518|nr:hypothetical protein [Collimonas sp. OK307]SFH93172.1 hypothetical protein SAMN04515618_10610 [Collimonas sp. OK307]
MLMTITALLNKTRLSFIAAFLFLLFIQPLIDPDYFWHLKTGEYIFSHHALPAGDIFSFTRFGQPWVLHEWLFEVVLYGMFAWLGPLGVKLLTITFAMSALGLVFVLTRRIGQSPTVAFVLMLVAIVPFAGSISPRPQLITYAFFAIFLFVLLSHKYYNAGRSLLLLPLLMVIWVNAHGGYVIGIALIGLFTVCEWIGYWTGVRESQKKQRLVWLTQITCATALASLVNPEFLARWLYPFQVLGMAANERIQEWQSPNFRDFGPKAYLTLVLIFILSYIFASRKPDTTEVVIPIFFLVTGFLAIRHIPVAVLTVIPFIALALSRGTVAAISASWHRSGLARWYFKWLGNSSEIGQREFALNWIVLVIFIISLMAYAPTFHAGDKEKTDDLLPVNAASFVAASGITGNMFNSYGNGGYLIYRLSPALKVFIDGRADVYGDKFFLDFLDIYEGKANWKEKFDRLSIDFVIVGKDAPIRQLLLVDSSFKEVYVDRHYSVLLRNTSKFQALLSKATNQGPG